MSQAPELSITIPLGTLMLGLFLSPLTAHAEPMILLCEYLAQSSMHTVETVDLLPREIVILEDENTVSWNDKTNVSAVMGHTQISFNYQGFHYSISRISGVIRFHNPEALKKWAGYRKRLADIMIAGGESPSVAAEEGWSRQEQEFDGREHVGQCERIEGQEF